MSKLSLKGFICLAVGWLNVSSISASFADAFEDLKLRSYGSFLHTERVPNALFFFDDIKANDSFELRKALRTHDIDSIVLASPGGSVWEGLNMAGIIFDKQLKTYIPKKGNCASACAFMFFAGNERLVDGQLGVHQFYSGQADKNAQIGESQESAQFTVSEIIGFLNEFGTPPFVYERMFQQSEMYYFYPDELKQLVTTVDDKHELFRKDVGLFITDFDSAIATYQATKLATKEDTGDKIPETTETITKTETPSEPKRDDEKLLIKKIQRKLNELGCKAGKADGIWGIKSQNALKQWIKISGVGEVSLAPTNSLFVKLQNSSKDCKTTGPDLSGMWVGSYSCNDTGKKRKVSAELKVINSTSYSFSLETYRATYTGTLTLKFNKKYYDTVLKTDKKTYNGEGNILLDGLKLLGRLNHAWDYPSCLYTLDKK